MIRIFSSSHIYPSVASYVPQYLLLINYVNNLTEIQNSFKVRFISSFFKVKMNHPSFIISISKLKYNSLVRNTLLLELMFKTVF